MACFEEEFGDNGEYKASLEINPGETQGWVVGPDGYSASLACLIDTGVLSNRTFEEHVVNRDIIDEIEEWAEENGY